MYVKLYNCLVRDSCRPVSITSLHSQNVNEVDRIKIDFISAYIINYCLLDIHVYQKTHSINLYSNEQKYTSRTIICYLSEVDKKINTSCIFRRKYFNLFLIVFGH